VKEGLRITKTVQRTLLLREEKKLRRAHCDINGTVTADIYLRKCEGSSWPRFAYSNLRDITLNVTSYGKSVEPHPSYHSNQDLAKELTGLVTNALNETYTHNQRHGVWWNYILLEEGQRVLQQHDFVPALRQAEEKAMVKARENNAHIEKVAGITLQSLWERYR
jgi:hypothetical protein